MEELFDFCVSPFETDTFSFHLTQSEATCAQWRKILISHDKMKIIIRTIRWKVTWNYRNALSNDRDSKRWSHVWF